MFAKLTGTGFDSLASSVGLRQWRLRYKGREILPRPLVSDAALEGSDAIPSPITASENIPAYKATVPEDSLRRAIGTRWKESLQPHAQWQLNKGSGWIDVRLQGHAISAPAGLRWGFTLIEKGFGEQ